MQRKLDKKNVYNAGKGKANQELIHLHMSNHYRRILNAKKTVDNSLPNCYKVKRPSTSNSVVAKNKVNRTLESPALTDRSISSSNKGSFWGTESYSGSSRYHARCIPEKSAFAISNKQNRINMELIDRIAYDTKHGPAIYCDEDRTEETNPHKSMEDNKNETKPSPSSKRRLTTTGSQESAHKRKLITQKKLKSSGTNIKGSKSFSSVSKKSSSNILKAEAVSKLRSFRVYYPPRKKKLRKETKQSSKQEIACPLEPPNCKCTKICICDTNETVLKKISFNPKEQSLTSSRDSAYNGGVSSLPESRSPTPDERRKKECCCCCCEKKQQQGVKSFVNENDIQSSKMSQKASRRATPKSKGQECQESLKTIQEDALYVKFIQDITTEVLEKSLYTNKALKKVMKKHISNNLTKLNKDRMLKEIENLRVQLGIPEDETLLNLEERADDGRSEILKIHSVISDSEFFMPISVADENVKGFASGMKDSDKLHESNSAVFSSGTENEKTVSVSETEGDGEIISVIQVTKAIREKRKERSIQKTPTMISRENSSDDSDSVFGSKKRSVLKNFKQKLLRSYSSSSSSDSDLSRKFKAHVEEQTKDKVFVSEETHPERCEQKYSSFTKKNRNVSFWKYPELSMNRTLEIKQEKTVTREKESSVSNDKRDKPKKD